MQEQQKQQKLQKQIGGLKNFFLQNSNFYKKYYFLSENNLAGHQVFG